MQRREGQLHLGLDAECTQHPHSSVELARRRLPDTRVASHHQYPTLSRAGRRQSPRQAPHTRLVDLRSAELFPCSGLPLLPSTRVPALVGALTGTRGRGRTSRHCAPGYDAPRPGLSLPAGHGRGLAIEQPSGQAVLACAAAFAGRAPTVRSLQARAPGRFTTADAHYWADRWRACLPPPHDAEPRASRLARDLARFRALRDDITVLEDDITALLASTDGQILTTLPGVAVLRAAAFAAHSLPIDRFPNAEHLYSATGLAPALYQSATLHRRGRISRQGLAEHRDALMGIAWGPATFSPAFAERDREYRARGMAPIQARVALARHACRLSYRLLKTQEPFDEEAYRRGRHQRGR
jgi:hypothetical protein